MYTIGQLLQKGVATLEKHVATPRLDAEILLAYVVAKPRSYLHTWPEKIISPKEANLFQELLARRKTQEPVAYLIGEKEFWSLSFIVTPDTLIPRPETECLVEYVLNLPFDTHQSLRIADLGTGCGAIAIALAKERPHWHFHATDISAAALKVAQENAQRLQVNNIQFSLGNWCQALPEEKFDVLVSNPPYIAEREWPAYANGLLFEPKGALVAGADGLVAIQDIAHQAHSYLRNTGFLCIEHGFAQGAQVKEIYTKEGYQDIVTIYDFLGHPRVTSGQYLPPAK